MNNTPTAELVPVPKEELEKLIAINKELRTQTEKYREASSLLFSFLNGMTALSKTLFGGSMEDVKKHPMKTAMNVVKLLTNPDKYAHMFENHVKIMNAVHSVETFEDFENKFIHSKNEIPEVSDGRE